MLLLQREHPLCPRVQSTNTCLYTRLYSSSPGHSTLPANRPCGPTVWGRGINSARHPIFAESLRNCACELASGRPAGRPKFCCVIVGAVFDDARQRGRGKILSRSRKSVQSPPKEDIESTGTLCRYTNF